MVGADRRIEQAADARLSNPSGRGDLLHVLGGRVESLVERYRNSLQAVEKLTTKLAERESRIKELEDGLAQLQRTRKDVCRRIDGVIKRVDRLQQAQG